MSEAREGRVAIENDGAAIEFERVLGAPAAVVWEMVSTRQGIGRWMAPAHVDLRVGGSIMIDFGDEGGRTGGEIVELISERVIEYGWGFDGATDSVVRFELEPIDESTTLLRLRHRRLPRSQAAGYGAGWHAHLDQLEQAVAGADPIEWDIRFAEVYPTYERHLV